ncbi:MAG: AAA family ATPase [Planctomycetaceae bacterium]|nr:AAA family ATPase [Planctomycetaceae bacterium]
MAKKAVKTATSSKRAGDANGAEASVNAASPVRRRQSPPPEERYQTELAFLRAWDGADRPEGWHLSPHAVVLFICGSRGEKLKLPAGSDGDLPSQLVIPEKFVGDRAIVERCVVTLAGERGLLLVGEPGTAKSMLSELLSAAISGTSALTIQGTAGSTEDHFRYSWNYAKLLANGPGEDALVPSPIMLGMRSGRLVRVEEVTRCLPEVQDALISLLSERRLMVPELHGDSGSVFAAPGFNLIATANLRDKGVSEMSAALKRRFNFEVISPIAEHAREVDLVRRQSTALLAESKITQPVDDGLLEAMVTAFRDLREGRTVEGWTVEKPGTVMSTAEAVAIAASIGRQTCFFPSQKDPLSLLPGQLLGVVLKDDAQDRARLLAYWDSAVARRAKTGSSLWKRLSELRKELEEQ